MGLRSRTRARGPGCLLEYLSEVGLGLRRGWDLRRGV
jgi:hypothetical protein